VRTSSASSSCVYRWSSESGSAGVRRELLAARKRRGDHVRVERPQIRYAWNGGISLAYQVVGEGPVELVYLQGFLSNVELNWENPALAHFLREFARLRPLVVTDRRGLRCSERFTPADTPPIEA
jgi:hypothetical protein